MFSTFLALVLSQQPVVEPPTPTISGRLVVIGRSIGKDGDKCFGIRGLSDLAGEIPVTIKDATGKIVALGNTSAGHEDKEIGQHSCVFDFRVPVPKMDFYTVEIGRRGSSNFSYAELVKQGWKVEFSIIPKW
jgi:hypothetical protein